MKKLSWMSALVCCVFYSAVDSGVSFAEGGSHDDMKKAMFQEHKAQMLKGMDEQIAALQSSKTCVAAANDHEALKTCHETIVNARKQYRSEMMDARIKRLEEQKAKMKH